VENQAPTQRQVPLLRTLGSGGGETHPCEVPIWWGYVGIAGMPMVISWRFHGKLMGIIMCIVMGFRGFHGDFMGFYGYTLQ